jgi:hypothetical protein
VVLVQQATLLEQTALILFFLPLHQLAEVVAHHKVLVKQAQMEVLAVAVDII